MPMMIRVMTMTIMITMSMAITMAMAMTMAMLMMMMMVMMMMMMMMRMLIKVMMLPAATYPKLDTKTLQAPLTNPMPCKNMSLGLRLTVSDWSFRLEFRLGVSDTA